MKVIATLTENEKYLLKSLEQMIESCFTYEDYKKDGWNYKEYIEPYRDKMGEELFNFVYNNKCYDLEQNYIVSKNTSTDCEGLTYNSLVKIKTCTGEK